MGYFQYLNTTIYGKKGLLPFETLSIQGAQKKVVSERLATDARKAEVALSFDAPMSETSGRAMLCAVRGIGFRAARG